MTKTKILEMINNNQIDELKAIIKDEIYQNSLSAKTGRRQRYIAMKRFFRFTEIPNKNFSMPCTVDFKGKKYTSFSNGYAIILTTEASGEMKLFDKPEDYLDINKYMMYDNKKHIRVDINKLLDRVKSEGYKLKKSEFSYDKFSYILKYEGMSYKLSILDIAYSIINDGEVVKVYQSSYGKMTAIILENSIGYCLILPFINTENDNVTVINLEDYIEI